MDKNKKDNPSRQDSVQPIKRTSCFQSDEPIQTDEPTQKNINKSFDSFAERHYKNLLILWLILNLIVMGLYGVIFFHIFNNLIIAIIGGFFGFFLYFLPSYIASHYEKKNLIAIFVLNLLLGWTLIGWIVSLVWALTYEENN